jgi:hypothetical protein
LLSLITSFYGMGFLSKSKSRWITLVSRLRNLTLDRSTKTFHRTENARNKTGSRMQIPFKIFSENIFFLTYLSNVRENKLPVFLFRSLFCFKAVICTGLKMAALQHSYLKMEVSHLFLFMLSQPLRYDSAGNHAQKKTY